MLAVAAALMAVSIVLLVLLGGDYTSKEASAGPAVSLPKVDELRRSGLTGPAPAVTPPAGDGAVPPPPPPGQ
jgi:hypothetical protein